MKVAVIGTGYVGLVVGACLAETGNDVVCADMDREKISRLEAGDLPIYEPSLEPLVRRNHEEKRLAFTTDVGWAVEVSDVVMIAVGTPPGEDGSADLQHVLDVARTIGEHMNRPKIVVTKSTVPVGTAEKVRRTIAGLTSERFHVCSNPEFLKEGAAVEDFMKPDRVVIGTDSEEARGVLEELYGPFIRTGGNRLILMDIASAELTKYAANAMLATRVSFMNEVAELCETLGADVGQVRRGLGSDPRIGPAFLFPGPGFGGSCFPKDLGAIQRSATEHGVQLEVVRAVEAVNDRQKGKVFSRLQAALGNQLKDRVVAVWGLAFKAETDDVRESPAIACIEDLLRQGAAVRAYDPHAIPTARRVLGDRVAYGADPYAVLDGADALAILTEWLVFRNPDFDRMRSLLRQPLIVDGRNLFEPARMRALGFRYFGIGRGERRPPATSPEKSEFKE
jgi:UDPglucose 6-dehydrogenase